MFPEFYQLRHFEKHKNYKDTDYYNPDISGN